MITLHTKEKLLFISKFLQDTKNIATLVPSSKALAIAGSRYISSSQPQTIVELGAGTGAITTVALQKIHPRSTYIAIERDPELAAVLQEACPGIKIILADAENIADSLRQSGIEEVDVLISSLPFFNLPSSAIIKILTWWQTITEKNQTIPFCQQTLIPWYYKKRYEQLFDRVEFNFVWKNIPPGGFYYCYNLRKNFAEHLK